MKVFMSGESWSPHVRNTWQEVTVSGITLSDGTVWACNSPFYAIKLSGADEFAKPPEPVPEPVPVQQSLADLIGQPMANISIQFK